MSLLSCCWKSSEDRWKQHRIWFSSGVVPAVWGLLCVYSQCRPWAWSLGGLRGTWCSKGRAAPGVGGARAPVRSEIMNVPKLLFIIYTGPSLHLFFTVCLLPYELAGAKYKLYKARGAAVECKIQMSMWWEEEENPAERVVCWEPFLASVGNNVLVAAEWQFLITFPCSITLYVNSCAYISLLASEYFHVGIKSVQSIRPCRVKSW